MAEPRPARPAILKYAILFGVLALLLAVGAARGRAYWLLLWPAASLGIVAGAYGGLGPGVFGKRADGRRAWWSRLLLGPYDLLAGGIWHASRILLPEPCAHEVRPRLWLGRRALPGELPAGVDLVVDLTAEFVEPRAIRAGRTYRSLPTLDNTAPADAAFGRLVAEVAAWPGVAYVHCASGHGRSAALVAAVLVARGVAADATEAETRVQQTRPGVRLNFAQRALVQRFAAGRPASPAEGSHRV